MEAPGQEKHRLSTVRHGSGHLQHLHRFRQNQLAIDTLSADEANLSVSGIQLCQSPETAVPAISHIVVTEITESQHRLARFNRRHIGAGVHRETQETIRLTGGQSRLPDIQAVAVLQLPDLLQRAVSGDESRISTVRPLQPVNQVNDIIRQKAVLLTRCGALPAKRRMQNAGGLMISLTVQGRIMTQKRHSYVSQRDAFSADGKIEEPIDRQAHFAYTYASDLVPDTREAWDCGRT